MSNLLLPRREILTQQPLFLAPILPLWRSKGLVFVHNPAVGEINLAFNAGALNSTGMPKDSGPAGLRINLAGASKSEFSDTGLAAAGNSLTLISIWRSKNTQYASEDTTRTLLSTRTAGNAGWGWGRISAIAGGATGNLTGQTFVLNGVAQYSEANSTIESLVDTVVALRVSGTTASWFRFGRKSSNNTTVGTTSTGATTIFGAGGPYSGAGTLWNDRAYLTLAFNKPLSDADIFALCKDVNSPWQIFSPRETHIFMPVSAGGTTSVSSDVSAAYNLLGSVQSSASATYTIIGAVQSDASASYSVRAEVSQDATASYNILSATSVTSSTTAGYNIIGSLTKDAAASYNVLGAVLKDGAATYGIRNAVTQDSSASYSILSSGAVTASVTAGYVIKGTLQSDIVVSYSISAAVQAEISASYFIHQAVEKDAPATYLIRGSISKAISAAYAVDGSTAIIYARAPAGAGPLVIKPSGNRPPQTATTRPGNTGGRRL